MVIRKKVSFIKRRLINRIFEIAREKRRIFSDQGIIYFDEKIDSINRVDHCYFYKEGEILSVDPEDLSGKTLLQIFETLRDNKIYIYRKIDDKFYKNRIKLR